MIRNTRIFVFQYAFSIRHVIKKRLDYVTTDYTYFIGKLGGTSYKLKRKKLKRAQNKQLSCYNLISLSDPHIITSIFKCLLLSKRKPVNKFTTAESEFKKRKLAKEQRIKVCFSSRIWVYNLRTHYQLNLALQTQLQKSMHVGPTPGFLCLLGSVCLGRLSAGWQTCTCRSVHLGEISASESLCLKTQHTYKDILLSFCAPVSVCLRRISTLAREVSKFFFPKRYMYLGLCSQLVTEHWYLARHRHKIVCLKGTCSKCIYL